MGHGQGAKALGRWKSPLSRRGFLTSPQAGRSSRSRRVGCEAYRVRKTQPPPGDQSLADLPRNRGRTKPDTAPHRSGYSFSCPTPKVKVRPQNGQEKSQSTAHLPGQLRCQATIWRVHISTGAFPAAVRAVDSPRLARPARCPSPIGDAGWRPGIRDNLHPNRWVRTPPTPTFGAAGQHTVGNDVSPENRAN